MNNNDVLRRLRYLLDYSDDEMRDIFACENYQMTPQKISSFMKKEEDEGYVEMGDSDMGIFLDGLITKLRGKREPKPGQKAERRMVPRNNNDLLKKLRIAFQLQESSMLEVFALGGFSMQKGELSAFFRKKGHKNYKPLGDQAFRKFLKGLLEYRDKGNLTGWNA